MAPMLGVPLRPVKRKDSDNERTSYNVQLASHTFENHLWQLERASPRGPVLCTKARHTLGALTGAAATAVRSCGSRLAFRLRNRRPYPRHCAAPPTVTVTSTPTPLSALPSAALTALSLNLEAEENDLMENLRELWQALSYGEHMQPAFVDSGRLDHVTGLLLAGNTDAVERDPDNDEVSGAAVLRLTSLRLETALLEVAAKRQAVCAERRRRRQWTTDEEMEVEVAGGGGDEGVAAAEVEEERERQQDREQQQKPRWLHRRLVQVLRRAGGPRQGRQGQQELGQSFLSGEEGEEEQRQQVQDQDQGRGQRKKPWEEGEERRSAGRVVVDSPRRRRHRRNSNHAVRLRTSSRSPRSGNPGEGAAGEDGVDESPYPYKYAALAAADSDA